MYAQLGNIRFEGLKGFTSFEQSYAVNYAQHERIQGKPRLESVGDSLDTISFDMYLHVDFADPETDIQTLRTAMLNREILPLILGNGNVLGRFVIPSLTKSTSFTDSNGNLIEATLSVELLEAYNDEPLNEEKKQAVSSAFATSDKNSNVRTTTPPKLSQGLTVSDGVADIQSSGKQVAQHTVSMEQNTATFEYYSAKINQVLNGMENSIAVVNQNLAIIGIATSIPTAMSGLYSRIQDIKEVLPVTDITSFKILNNKLQNSVVDVKNSASGLNNKSIIRRI